MAETLASPATPRTPEPPRPAGAAGLDDTLVRADAGPPGPEVLNATLPQLRPGPPPFAPPPAAAGGVGVPGYEVIGEIGRGGMGVVYKARQTSLNRLVALKMVRAGGDADDGHHDRFRAEAEVVARLSHPHIVQIHEVGEHAGRPFLALELVNGNTLQSKIGGTPQPLRPAAHLVELLARAVHFAHTCGVVHRDLKPGNVLLAPPLDGAAGQPDTDAAQVAALYGVPKITDFGLARRLEDDSQHTCSGQILGTPSYMAPEQAAGQAFAAGPAADVYALGAILYDMLTGRPPFKGATPVETINQVLNEEPLPPGRLRPRLPRDLELICLKCLEKDPHRRYDSAAELADDLRRHLDGESVRVRPAPPHERVWRWSRRNPIPASLLVAITLGAGLGFLHLSQLSKSLVRSTALEGAAQQTETMDELNRYYTKVANHLDRAGVKGAPDLEVPRAGHPPEPAGDLWSWLFGQGPRADVRVPAPATLTIELGQQIGERSASGVRIRLYSDYPFRQRTDGGPRDEFERTALEQLRKNPKQPVSSFVEIDGQPVLRYATARVMSEGCVDCHNKHPESTKTDWKVGDVRGVLEIIRPLEKDEERVNRGLRGTVFLVAGTGATLLGLSVLLLLLGNRRRRPSGPAGAAAGPESSPPTAAGLVHETTHETAGRPQPETEVREALPPAADQQDTPVPDRGRVRSVAVGGCPVVFGDRFPAWGDLAYTAALDSERQGEGERVAGG